VYARENGHGMAFEPEGPQDVSADDEAEILSETDGALPTDQDPDEPPPRRGHLKVIK
jgi:stringent starvation protein B